MQPALLCKQLSVVIMTKLVWRCPLGNASHAYAHRPNIIDDKNNPSEDEVHDPRPLHQVWCHQHLSFVSNPGYCL